MGSLVHEIQLDAANSEVSVSALLRKALIVSTKLNVFEDVAWIKAELSGYGDGISCRHQGGRRGIGPCFPSECRCRHCSGSIAVRETKPFHH